MNDPGLWKQQFLTNGTRKLLPVEVALVAASAQPVLPSSLGILEDRFEHLDVATDTLVLVMAAQFRAQGPILLVQGRMAILPTPCPDPFHTPAQAFPDRLPLDDPVSTACLGPIGGTSQNVACPLAPCRGGSAWRPLERTQHRLFGMNGQATAMQTLRQDVHDPVGVRFERDANDTIIGKTRHQAPALHPGLHLLDTPCVQDMMPQYVGS
jgi:hypothetical protein